ncbi:MAG: hypothetical protein LBU34_06375 [Planctomycetaceae bacterium]|jgi:hypothetical protein|nr:hypothetical protein [Planctomycetaceae bacterium]
MSYFQPLITSAFSNYSVNRNIYVDRAAVQDNAAKNQKTESNQNGINVSDPDFGKPQSASGDILDLSSDVQKRYESASDANKTDSTKANPAVKSSDDSVTLQTREDSPTTLETAETATSKNGLSEAELTSEEQQQVQKLKARDLEVRTHEAAHVAAGSPYVTGGPTYTYQTGPDGKSYAIGGEVGIDTGEISGDPEATIRKMQTVAAAALAPAEPSGQDQKVAAAARQKEIQARAELARQNREVLSGGKGNENSDSSQLSVESDPKSSSATPSSATPLPATVANQSDGDKSNKSDVSDKEVEVTDSGLFSTVKSFVTGRAKSSQQSSAYQVQSSMSLSSTSQNRFSVFV